MEKRIIKKTGEKLSPIGLGAMRLPSKNGKINYAESEKLIHHAILQQSIIMEKVKKSLEKL